MRSFVMALEPILPSHIDPHSVRVSATTPLSQVMGSIRPDECVLVMDRERVIGLITERDSIRLAAHRESWVDLQAREVMTDPIQTVPYREVKQLDQALGILRQRQVTHLGVISDTGELLGLLSSDTIRRALEAPVRSHHGDLRCADRLSIETELKENEAKLAGILDTADEAIISINEHQIIQIFNQGAERIFGYTADEVLGQPLSILIPESYHAIHQHHIATFRGPSNASKRMVGSGGEIWGRRKTGEIFPAEASISRLVTREGLLFTSILQDVTERRRAEQALQRNQSLLQKIIDNSPSVIAVMDPNHDHLLVNRSYADLIGKPQDWIVGRSVKEFWPPEIAATLMEHNRKILSSNRPLQVEEILPHADGPHTYISSLFPLQAEQGELYAICSISTDISDRKAIEQLKDEFISVVSHELRTPLTSIHGSLKLLSSGHLGQITPEGQEVLEIAAENTQRLIRLVSDVLDLERIQDHQFKLQKEICDADQILTQATDMLRSLADQQGIALEVCPSPVQLWGMPDLILQTLTNLLSNAIKFSPDHTTIGLQATSRESEVIVQIQDQGRGIPADQLETIFERFQQVDASDSRAKGGTGLGLAICRNIIEKHGGRIWVESRLGEGSTFYFTLPKAPDPTGEEL